MPYQENLASVSVCKNRVFACTWNLIFWRIRLTMENLINPKQTTQQLQLGQTLDSHFLVIQVNLPAATGKLQL